MPGAEVLLFNPICPHRMHDRAYVIPPEKTIALTFPEKTRDIEVCIDGQIFLTAADDDMVTVTRAAEHANIIRPADFSFFKRLRHKLSLG